MPLLLALLLAQGALPSQAQLEVALGESVAASCPRLKLKTDPDLRRACKEYVDACARGLIQPSNSGAFFYATLESWELSVAAGVATVSPPSSADRAVGQIIPGCSFNRAGIAAAVLPSGEATVCVLTARHESDLDPIPGKVRAGESVQISGRLAEGLSKPRIFVTRPGGDVEELPLPSGKLEASVPLKERGEHSIEVLADSAQGPQVIALRRVFAGVPRPAVPPPEVKRGPNLDDVEAAITQLRASRGLPALKRDAELDAVAEGHSREMARTRTFAHVLPSDGSLSDRLDAKGYARRSASENLGFAIDAGEAHEAIASSPAHLSNLLDPRHRRIGLGEARGQTSEGSEGVYLTEVFTSPIVGSADPVGDVARSVAKARERANLEPLRRDDKLDQLALHEVRAVALKDKVALSPDFTQRVIQAVPELEGVVGELMVVTGADDVERSKYSAEPRWTRLGVGAIYASSKQLGPGRLWVLLLYAK